MSPFNWRGLYAITPDGITPEVNDRSGGRSSLARIDAVLREGAAAIQYRDKTANPKSAEVFVKRLKTLCRSYRRPLIVNDSLELAAAAEADGLHLGEHDGDIRAARAALGPHVTIGASCYNRPERAENALADGADYLAFGSVFPTATKPDAAVCPLSLIGWAKLRFDCPIVAIGGITPENGAVVIDAGADMLAVISGVFAPGEERRRSRAFAALFETRFETDNGQILHEK